MENAPATRLRFKGSATSSSKKRKHSDSRQHRQHAYLDSHDAHISSSSRTSRRTPSHSRSPERSSKDKEDSQRRSKHISKVHLRSHSPSSSSRSRSSKYKVTPAGFAPDSLDSYCFDDNEDLETAYMIQLAREMRADELEKQRVEEEAANDPWLSHLFDEMANDDPYGYHSGRFSTQTSTPGSVRKQSKIQSLSDDAYTSYMRKGMGRSAAQKEFMEWAEWVEEQEQRKYKDARIEQKRRDEERSRRRQERRERERLDEETEANARTGIKSHQSIDDTPANRLRKRALVDQARRVYEEGWRALLVEDSQDITTVSATTIPRMSLLSMGNIPWPPLHGSSESLEVSDTPAADSVLSLFDFLFFGTTADQADVRKQLLRREQLKFHPDKFKQRFGARLPPPQALNDTSSSSSSSSSAAAVGIVPGERERILEHVDKVARALNELGEMF
ncbi:hypothetical protein EC991_000899 [Linnemannia zychae]|nr:hypothetical protein EC991_000899 [Linnemannia zychae]